MYSFDLPSSQVLANGPLVQLADKEEQSHILRSGVEQMVLLQEPDALHMHTHTSPHVDTPECVCVCVCLYGAKSVPHIAHHTSVWPDQREHS